MVLGQDRSPERILSGVAPTALKFLWLITPGSASLHRGLT